MQQLQVTEATLALLAQRRVYHGLDARGRWRVGDRIVFHPSLAIEPYCQLNAGYWLPAGMGAFSYSHSPMGGHVILGRYCSIGSNVSWMGGRHPLEWTSTSPVNYGPAQVHVAQYFEDVAHRRRVAEPPASDQAVRIGHDVWIGDEAMIAPGVRIGDGAVIGARSLVLKDVPPFAVVGGSPARLIRPRFGEALCERLKALAWWRFAPDAIQSCAVEDPERFVGEMEELLAAGRLSEIRPGALVDATALEATAP